MAITFSTGNYLKRTTNLLNYNSPYTVMGLFYVTSSSVGTFFNLTNNPSSGGVTDFDKFGLNSGSYDLATTKSGVFSLATPAFSLTNQWMHFAAVRSDVSTILCYENGVLLTSPDPFDITGRVSIVEQRVGQSADGDPRSLIGSGFNFFEYDAALTQQEIQAQMWRYRPQRTANLRAWMPTFVDSTRNKDFSGNGFDYTEVGSIVNASGLLLPLSPLITRKRPPIYYASPSMLLGF